MATTEDLLKQKEYYEGQIKADQAYIAKAYEKYSGTQGGGKSIRAIERSKASSIAYNRAKLLDIQKDLGLIDERTAQIQTSNIQASQSQDRFIRRNPAPSAQLSRLPGSVVPSQAQVYQQQSEFYASQGDTATARELQIRAAREAQLAVQQQQSPGREQAFASPTATQEIEERPKPLQFRQAGGVTQQILTSPLSYAVGASPGFAGRAATNEELIVGTRGGLNAVVGTKEKFEYPGPRPDLSFALGEIALPISRSFESKLRSAGVEIEIVNKEQQGQGPISYAGPNQKLSSEIEQTPSSLINANQSVNQDITPGARIVPAPPKQTYLEKIQYFFKNPSLLNPFSSESRQARISYIESTGGTQTIGTKAIRFGVIGVQSQVEFLDAAIKIPEQTYKGFKKVVQYANPINVLSPEGIDTEKLIVQSEKAYKPTEPFRTATKEFFKTGQAPESVSAFGQTLQQEPERIIAPIVFSSIATEGAIAAANTISKTVTATKQVDVVRSATISQKGAVVRTGTGLGAEGGGPVVLKQVAKGEATVETITTKFLRAPEVKTTQKAFVVEQKGRGAVLSRESLINTNLKAAELRLNYERLIQDTTKKVSLPTTEPKGKLQKIGGQQYDIFKTEQGTSFISEERIRTPNYKKPVEPQKALLKSLPISREEQVKQFGAVKQVTEQEREIKKLIFKQGEREVSGKAPIFSGPRKRLTIPDKDLIGIGTERTLTVAEVDKGLAKRIARVSRVETPDVVDIFTGKPFLSETVISPTKAFVGGRFGAYKGQDIEFKGKLVRRLEVDLTATPKKRPIVKKQKVTRAGPEPKVPQLPGSQVVPEIKESNKAAKDLANVESRAIQNTKSIVESKAATGQIQNADIAASVQIDRGTAKRAAKVLFERERVIPGRELGIKTIDTLRIGGFLAGASRIRQTPIIRTEQQPRAESIVQQAPKTQAVPRVITQQTPRIITQAVPRVQTFPRTIPQSRTITQTIVNPVPPVPSPVPPPIVPPLVPFRYRPGDSKAAFDFKNAFLGLREYKVATPKQFLSGLGIGSFGKGKVKTTKKQRRF